MKYILALTLILFTATTSQADPALTAKAESYLNKLTTLETEFEQIDNRGNRAGGTFSLERPGKFRWEYDKRQPVLIVSNGKQLVYYDKALKEVTYTTTENTLASFLAKPTIKFSGDIELVDSGRSAGKFFVEVAQVKKPEEGKLKLIFNESPMEIEGLEITDAYGNVTSVRFTTPRFGTQIAAETFVFKDPKRVRDAWQR